MNKKLSIAAILVAVLAISCSALASASTLRYDVSSDYQGIDVPWGAEVHPYAETNDLTVYQVVFQWKDPDRNDRWDPVIVTTYTTSPDGTTRTFNGPSHTPDEPGDWAVHVEFYSPNGNVNQDYRIHQGSTSFFVLPESAFGALAAIGAAFAALGFVKLKRKR